MRALATAGTVVRAFGWRGLIRRSSYTISMRTGRIARSTPAAKSFERYDAVPWAHRFDLEHLRARYDALPRRQERQRRVEQKAADVLEGFSRLYGWADVHVGWPPNWHVNPFTGHEYPLSHWSAISEHAPAVGDIKDVWELSRLPFTYLFARAWLLSHEDRYAEAWWQAVEDWARANPPNTGVNWRCGQETSLRAIAVCFGLSVFGGHASTSPDRLDLAHRILGASILRVRPTLDYALSQRNNHAVSELVFLLSVVGPERRLCRALLEVLDDQFRPDGSYGQQSFNYQRLAVQALQWLLLTRNDLPPGLRIRVVDVIASSREFLIRCSDPVSGWLPNYGANDGALLFPLDDAHQRDFRPFLASLGDTSISRPLFETCLWLGMHEVAVRGAVLRQHASTYVTLGGPRSLLLTRVGIDGERRPGHADQLAVDLWIGGRNVVIDPGSYRYTAPPPWENALTGPEVHSMIRATGESIVRLGRFLSTPMSAAQLVHRRVLEDGEVVVARRHASSGTLWRAIIKLADRFVIVDYADGIDMEVRWNLGSHAGVRALLAPEHLVSDLPSADHDPASGWVSSLYAYREPCSTRVIVVPPGGVTVAVFAAQGVDQPKDMMVPALLRGMLPDDVVGTAMRLLQS